MRQRAIQLLVGLVLGLRATSARCRPALPRRAALAALFKERTGRLKPFSEPALVRRLSLCCHARVPLYEESPRLISARVPQRVCCEGLQESVKRDLPPFASLGQQGTRRVEPLIHRTLVRRHLRLEPLNFR